MWRCWKYDVKGRKGVSEYYKDRYGEAEKFEIAFDGFKDVDIDMPVGEVKIEEGDSYTTISITVKLNKELEALILSFGDDIEVLEPVDFRRRIADKIKGMNEKYNQI